MKRNVIVGIILITTALVSLSAIPNALFSINRASALNAYPTPIEVTSSPPTITPITPTTPVPIPKGLMSAYLSSKSSGIKAKEFTSSPIPKQSISEIKGWGPQRSLLTNSKTSPDRVIGTEDRFRINTTNNYPWSTVVKIYYDRDGANWGCSGWMLGASAIATAGHCIYDKNTTDKWGSNYIIIPGLNGSNSPYNQCEGWTGHVDSEWANNRNSDYDWGVITLKCQIGYTTGVLGFRSTSGDINGLTDVVTGYPIADHPDGNDVGTSMWAGTGKIQASNPLTIDYDNDATRGQSGSPSWQINNIPSGCSTPCVIGNFASEYDPPAWNRGVRITSSLFDVFYQWRQFKWYGVYIPLVSNQ